MQSRTGIINSNVVGIQWKLFQLQGKYTQLSMNMHSSNWTPSFCKIRHVTTRDVAQNIKINVGYVEKIIQDHLHMHKISACWLPHLLTAFDKKE